jgi:hypothetical protein
VIIEVSYATCHIKAVAPSAIILVPPPDHGSHGLPPADEAALGAAEIIALFFANCQALST